MTTTRLTRGRIVLAALGAFLVAAFAAAGSAAAASVSVNPNTAASGQVVQVTGSGYLNNSNVSLYDNGVFFNNVITNNQGGFSTPYTVPFNSNVGNHTITATDPNGTTASTNLNVTTGGGGGPATLHVDPANAPAGATIILNGTGFADNETVNVVGDDGSQLAQTQTSFGNFSTTAIVPTSFGTGTHTITATGLTSGRVATTQFTANNGNNNGGGCGTGGACFTNNTPTAAPGQQLALSGTGYMPGEQIAISAENGTGVGTATADGGGNFASTGTVPQGLAPGNHVLTARGTSSQRSATAQLTVTGNYAPYSPVGPPTGSGYSPYSAYNPYNPYAAPNGYVAPPTPGVSPTAVVAPAPRPQYVAPPTQAVRTSSPLPFTGTNARRLMVAGVSVLFAGLLLLSGRALAANARK